MVFTIATAIYERSLPASLQSKKEEGKKWTTMSFSKLGPPQIPPTKCYPEIIYICFKIQDARVGEGKIKITRSNLQKLPSRSRFAKWKMWFLSLTPFPYYKTSKDFNEILLIYWAFFPSSHSDARWGGRKGKNHTIQSAKIILKIKICRMKNVIFEPRTLPPLQNINKFERNFSHLLGFSSL